MEWTKAQAERFVTLVLETPEADLPRVVREWLKAEGLPPIRSPEDWA